jgi:hypothetical protein
MPESKPTTTPLPNTVPIEASENAENMYKGQKSMLILCIGKSGRGKSTAMRNLDPEKTFLINVLGKPLPFPSGIKYEEKVNMCISSDPATIARTMMEVSRNPKWENLVIDDGHYVMATEFMNKALEKGFDKFTLMAKHIFDIVILATKLRPGLKVFFLTHEEDTGTERKMKTLGKLLDDKVTLEGLSTTVLFSEVVADDTKRAYYFTTQSDGYTTAKSPFDMFPYRMVNDLDVVGKRIDEYYKGVALKDSKLKFIE